MLNLVKIYLDTYLAVVLCSSKGVTDVIVVHLKKILWYIFNKKKLLWYILTKKKLLWYMLNKTVIVVQLQQKSYCGTSYHKGGTSYKKEVIVVYIKQKSYCGTTSTKKLLWYILTKSNYCGIS